MAAKSLPSGKQGAELAHQKKQFFLSRSVLVGQKVIIGPASEKYKSPRRPSSPRGFFCKKFFLC